MFPKNYKICMCIFENIPRVSAEYNQVTICPSQRQGYDGGGASYASIGKVEDDSCFHSFKTLIELYCCLREVVK